jgi:DNA-binding transcriptional regulator YiaG
MPNIAKVLKDEMQRLARKEVKAALAKLQKDNATLKRVAADHKRRLLTLERANRRLLKYASKNQDEAVNVKDEEIGKARVTAKMIRSIRAKLNLSQAEFAALIGVNGQSVYQWEHKEGRLTFRGNTKAAIVALRKLNRKEAQQRLEALRKK